MSCTLLPEEKGVVREICEVLMGAKWGRVGARWGGHCLLGSGRNLVQEARHVGRWLLGTSYTSSHWVTKPWGSFWNHKAGPDTEMV